MLEEILKGINSNLERIANAQEKRLAFMKEPVEITAEDVQKAVKVIENADVATPQPIPAQTMSTQQTVVTTPVQQANIQADAQVVQTTMTAQPIPTTPVQESFTQEQLAVAMSNAVSAGKMNVIQNILQMFNVQALTQINPADYNKVAAILKENGVNV